LSARKHCVNQSFSQVIPILVVTNFAVLRGSCCDVDKLVTSVIPGTADEVFSLILAAFVLDAHSCLSPGLADVISSIGDVIVTLAGVFWNIPLS
jgi:hypothetical protein